MDPPTEEELKAIIEKATKDGPPANIMRILQAISQCQTLGVASFIAKDSRTVHYVLVIPIEGGNALPVAILPSIPPDRMLTIYETLVMKHGAHQSDPEFTGVLQ